jgi:hypothetical protein
MAWLGWVSYGGTEIINVARTETYCAWARLPWFKAVYKNDSLAPMLGETYISPTVDNSAPWLDPNAPESYDFYGVYPLSVTGIEDSSRTSAVTQNVGDGAFATTLRHGSKSPVFNVVLVGESDAAVDYGFKWLKQALNTAACDDGGLPALCYLASEPHVDLEGSDLTWVTVEDTGGGDDLDGGTPSDAGGDDVDGGGPTDLSGGDLDGGTPSEAALSGRQLVAVDIDPTDCLVPLLRSLHQVQFNSGPTVTAKHTLPSGGEAWTVTFSGIAQEPWEYGEEVEVISGFLDPTVIDPWVGGLPDGASIDLDGAILNEDACTPEVLAPLEDPLCPTTVAPPPPPSITLGCFQLPANWRRRQITIPSTYIPVWGEVVPKFSVHANDADVRYLRIRFYTDTDGDGDVTGDPCAFCGDIVISYIPAGHTLVFDASQRQVYVTDSAHRRRRADAVVSSADGTPFEWPILTCGVNYVLTLDLPQTQAPPVFDLSFFSRAA